VAIAKGDGVAIAKMIWLGSCEGDELAIAQEMSWQRWRRGDECKRLLYLTCLSCFMRKRLIWCVVYMQHADRCGPVSWPCLLWSGAGGSGVSDRV
jgi:hypothetical protein